MPSRLDLPEGDVTFLFTDVEGSTRLLERYAAEYGAKLARHHELLAEAVGRRGGVVFETVGDAVYAAFPDPTDAVEAAAEGQLALAREDWGPLGQMKVRMGLHTGPVERRGTHYFGAALYRCARLMATAHGGQIVLSELTAGLVRGSLTAALLDLGQHQLKDMREPERVFQVVSDGLETDFPPLRSAGGRPNNLPADVKTFVGRHEELDGLCSLLVSPDTRIVTVTGPGGSGKTRLALRAAESLLEPSKDGVFLVDLSPLASAELVAPAIASVLGVQKAADRSVVAGLVTHLAAKELLLVLDNFEHVLPAATDVADLLASAPAVKVLATSRSPLHIQGEHEFRIGPLPLPEADAMLAELVRSPAVQLFVERALEIRADFALTDANGNDVRKICSRLDGLPLAIELAASWTRLLSPSAVLERMDNRLGFLTGGAADLPSRQRTLRDAIAWSYDLLDEPEQTLLRRLAAFRGGCDLPAAEAVCGGDVLTSLSRLVENSLIETRWNEKGEPRFVLLETILEFARERLAESGETDELARRHAAYFADHAEAIEPALYTDERLPWLLRLADDRDNVRSALAWSAERDEASYGLRILGALWLWWWTAFSEGMVWADRLLALPSAAEPTKARARALFAAEICAAGAGDMPLIRSYTEEAVTLSRSLDDDTCLALAQGLGAGALAGLKSGAGAGFEDADGPRRLHELSTEAIEVGAGTGDPWIAAWVKMISGLIALLVGDPVTARPWASEAVDEFGALDDSWSRATASITLAFSLVQLGELDAAEATLGGSVSALMEVGDLKMANSGLIAHGLLARLGGDADGAERHYADALDLCVKAGDPANAPICLEGIAAAVAGRDPERAARLLGAARALFDGGAQPAVPGFEVFYQTTRVGLEEVLGADAAARLGTEGASRARAVPLADVTHA